MVSLILYKIPSSAYNRPLQFRFNMPNPQKPAVKMSKENPQASSTSTRLTSASEPLQTQISPSNGAKDAETAALVNSLQGQLFLKKY